MAPYQPNNISDLQTFLLLAYSPHPESSSIQLLDRHPPTTLHKLLMMMPLPCLSLKTFQIKDLEINASYDNLITIIHCNSFTVVPLLSLLTLGNIALTRTSSHTCSIKTLSLSKDLFAANHLAQLYPLTMLQKSPSRFYLYEIFSHAKAIAKYCQRIFLASVIIIEI